MIPPTPKHAAIIGSIKRLSVAGSPPSYRQVMRDIGVTNLGSFHGMLKVMKERGLIDFEPRRARTLRVCGEGGVSIDTLATLPSGDLLALQRRIRFVLRERGLQ